MQPCHTPAATSAVFDDPNLVSSAGLVPLLALARTAGLHGLADEHLTVPTDKGANAGLKVSSLVAGMIAGADSIDDMELLRHGGMRRLFAKIYAPSTLGSFLRAFTFGHVRQLDAVASRFLARLTEQAPLLVTTPGERVMVDVDDTIIEVHGYTKIGSGYGYTRVRGLNVLLATATTTTSAPVVLGQRLRKGACGSPRGSGQMIRETLATLGRLTTGPGTGTARPLVRTDSAFYSADLVHAAAKAGADVSITMRMLPNVKDAIASITDQAWIPIEYTDAIYDEDTSRWISRAEVAEVPFTAFATNRKHGAVTGRLVVRRIPDLNQPSPEDAAQDGTVQDQLFTTWRFHAFFTTTPAEGPDMLDTVTADKTHRTHAVIEKIHADLKHSALAHLPSANFAANSAWLVLAVIAFNLTRAAATLTGPDLARATTATIRRKIINIAARIATSARRVVLHLPNQWPWERSWQRLFTAACGPPTPTPTT